MRMIALWAAVALVLAWQTTAYGQAAHRKAASTPQLTAPLPVVQQPTASKDLAEVTARLVAIDSAIEKLTEKTGKTDYMPAVLGLIGSLLGVLIGGFITFRNQTKSIESQWKIAKESVESQWNLAEKAAAHTKGLADAKADQERELARNRAGLEIGNSLIQWQLKQLSELYGPLRALFLQSNAMYRHMNAVLEKADPKLFRLAKGSPGDYFDGMVFKINLSEQWIRFRTVMHIGEVYGRDYGIEDYFDELVVIGGRIVDVIEQKAGYARPDQPDLPSVFGKYLAHYSVLNRLHSAMKAKYAPPSQVAVCANVR